MSDTFDSIDSLATKAFEGYVVRKDLVRRFKGQYPVPTYVAEFLLGRYCASTDEEEIAEGLKIVERQLTEKTVRAGEHELFKARAKDKGQIKLIDIITARLDAATDSFIASLPSLQLKDVRIASEMVHDNERMLTGGFYAEVEVTYDPTIAQERNGRPFAITHARFYPSFTRDAPPSRPRNGSTSSSALPAWNRTSSLPAPRTSPCSGWSPSWSAITTWSNSGLAAPARATFSSRSPPTPTWCPVENPPSPGCS